MVDAGSEHQSEYELIYWPVLPGRGEVPRLLLEDAGARYVDLARLPEDQGGGFQVILEFNQGKKEGFPPYAPPILRHGEVVLSQTSNICLYLGPRLGLAPGDEVGRLHVNQLTLTLMDVFAEAHDVHHPISTSLYYDDQKEQALAAAREFVTHRLPKYLGYFERVLAGRPWLVGDACSYADLALFQALEGLEHAFPRGYKAVAEKVPGLRALRKRVSERPKLAAYLASERRLPFNENGIFRFYPELDVEPVEA